MTTLFRVLGNIINGLLGIFRKKSSTSDVQTYWSRFNNIEALSTQMKADGFAWKTDGRNFTPETDTEASPEQVLSFKGGNCNDFCRFFREFCEYRKCADVVTMFYMRSKAGDGWHWAQLIKVYSEWFVQSNMDVLPCPYWRDPFEQFCAKMDEWGWDKATIVEQKKVVILK